MTNSNLAFLAKSDCKASIMSDVKPEPVPPPYACETIKPYIDKGRNVFLVSSILPKNERKKNRPNYYGTSSQIVFIHFLEKLKTPKRHFEIN